MPLSESNMRSPMQTCRIIFVDVRFSMSILCVPFSTASACLSSSTFRCLSAWLTHPMTLIARSERFWAYSRILFKVDPYASDKLAGIKLRASLIFLTVVQLKIWSAVRRARRNLPQSSTTITTRADGTGAYTLST